MVDSEVTKREWGHSRWRHVILFEWQVLDSVLWLDCVVFLPTEEFLWEKVQLLPHSHGHFEAPKVYCGYLHINKWSYLSINYRSCTHHKQRRRSEQELVINILFKCLYMSTGAYSVASNKSYKSTRNPTLRGYVRKTDGECELQSEWVCVCGWYGWMVYRSLADIYLQIWMYLWSVRRIMLQEIH